MRRKALLVGLGLAALAAALMIPVGGGSAVSAEGAVATNGTTEGTERGHAMDLSRYSDEPPGDTLDMLFIHHSIGGQLLAPEGPDVGESCIYESHPNGGGMRALLEDAGYRVHEASYDSLVGHRTDLFDWLPKFRSDMGRILRTQRQDQQLPDGRVNQIVAFKSCFPNSKLRGRGVEPGDPAGPELTLANAKATMRALRDVLAAHPDTLFVYFTAPPLAPNIEPEPAWKWLARKVLSREWGPEQLRESSALARELNDWLQAPDGWLEGYPHDNIVIFDYFDLLTGEGPSNVLAYANGKGIDAHPSAEGNRLVAPEFVRFLNRAVRRAGLVEEVEPASDEEGDTSASAATEGRVLAESRADSEVP